MSSCGYPVIPSGVLAEVGTKFAAQAKGSGLSLIPQVPATTPVANVPASVAAEPKVPSQG